MHTTTIHFEDWQAQSIEILAERREMTPSELVRTILIGYLEDYRLHPGRTFQDIDSITADSTRDD